MPTHGLLKKVWDNKGHWALVIDVDEHGEHKINLWDKKFAGESSEEHPAICDVHDWEGKRVIYTAKAGKPKGDDPADCWPASIVEISLEETDVPSVRELVEEIELGAQFDGDKPPVMAPEKPSDPQKSPDPYNLDNALMRCVTASTEWAEAQKHLIESLRRNFPFGAK